MTSLKDIPHRAVGAPPRSSSAAWPPAWARGQSGEYYSLSGHENFYCDLKRYLG